MTENHPTATIAQAEAHAKKRLAKKKGVVACDGAFDADEVEMIRYAMILALGLCGCGSSTGGPSKAPASRGNDEIVLRGEYRCWGGNMPTVNYNYSLRPGVKQRTGGDYWFVFEHHGSRKEEKIGQIPATEVTASNSYADWMESNRDSSPAKFWIEFRPTSGRVVRVSQVVSSRDVNRPAGK